ncbi:hypothetical protein [Marinifilum fragile]|uniref:hypothetical protein n=1 Tax=Marinifilum fragile TaxID=570161 RepID=UPI000A6E2481|nr:hypothetical protein [Marinifilum fragile]
MAKISSKDALRYHAEGRPGKIEVIPTKPYRTQRDLALAIVLVLLNHVLKLKKTLQMLIVTQVKEIL